MTARNFSAKQLQTIDLLAIGVPHSKIAKKLDISTRQITNWKTDDDFVAEIEKRRSEINTTYNNERAEITAVSLAEYLKELQVYKKVKIDIQQEFTSLGLTIARRVAKRLEDLPDEAITPAMIPHFVRIAIDCADEGTGAWAELIGLGKVFHQAKERGSEAGSQINS